MNSVYSVLIVIFGSLLCGCGGGVSDAPVLATVEGIVTWKGLPLAEAAVAFTPESGPIATGTTDAAGHFKLTTQGSEGAPIGSHRVTIQAYEAPPEGKPLVDDNGEPTYTPVSKIPKKYGNLNESGLEANVSAKGEDNTFQFDLE